MPGGVSISYGLCNAQTMNTSLSNGNVTAATSPTSGATANTKGSWVSIGTTTYDSELGANKPRLVLGHREQLGSRNRYRNWDKRQSGSNRQ